jgi:hypothetical protein
VRTVLKVSEGLNDRYETQWRIQKFRKGGGAPERGVGRGVCEFFLHFTINFRRKGGPGPLPPLNPPLKQVHEFLQNVITFYDLNLLPNVFTKFNHNNKVMQYMLITEGLLFAI